MPSLESLEKFKLRFEKIGNEQQINAQEGVARDDYTVPDNEPAPLPEPPAAEAPPAPETAPDSEAFDDGVGMDIDFGALTATPPEALVTPEPPAQDAGAEEMPDLSSLSLGDEILPGTAPTGVPDAVVDSTADSPVDSAPEGIALDDMSDLSGLDLGDGIPAEITPDGASGPTPEDGVPEGIALDDMPDLSGLDLGDGIPAEITPDGIPAGTPADGVPEIPAEGIALGETSDLDLGDEAALDKTPDIALDGAPEVPVDDGVEGIALDDMPDLSGLGFGDEIPENAPLEDTIAASSEEKNSLVPDMPADDAFDAFDPAAFASGPGGAPADDGLPGLDAFAIPGLTEDGKPPAIAPRPAEEVPSASHDIALSDDDLRELLQTLDSYPLNLRIACEEILTDENTPGSAKSRLVMLLVNGGSPREAAEAAGRITKKSIVLPKGALKKTAKELEAEQKSLKYIFVQKFLPIITITLIVGILGACISYLTYNFIIKPVQADMLYKEGYAAIGKGQYERANQRFADAFKKHPVKEWFYKYAEAFRDEKQYIYAERKYDELLIIYKQDKKGALDYARMESQYVRNYEKADRIIRENILDYNADDPEGLIALGDINLDWGDSDPEEYYGRYEEARLAYARYITVKGQSPPVMERMLKYFIRTDNLGEVIRLQKSFMNARKVPIAASTLSELGGYLLDKRLEKPDRVLDAHIDNIEGIKDVLIRAVQTDDEYRKKEYKRTGRVPPPLPEPHYQLARYYHFYNAPLEERQTLETAAAAFDAAVIENPKRTRSRIETQRMLADMMIKDLQWFDAEDTLAKGVSIYEDALERRIVKRRYADAGKLYAALGNIEYFIKNDDMESAVRYYLAAERNDWSPPEQQYRIGAAYYHLENYPAALERFFDVSMLMPYNRRLLSALGNVSYLRSDYFAAQGYYNRLVRLLESDRLRFPSLTPDERADHAELLRRLMIALNNQGVALSALSARTGKPAYRVEALARFSESARYWDLLSRDNNMVRPGLVDPGIPGKSLPYLNIRQTLYPVPGANPQLYNTIDKDVLEPSEWEELASKTDVPGG